MFTISHFKFFNSTKENKTLLFVILWFLISSFQIQKSISPEVFGFEELSYGLMYAERTNIVNYSGVPKGYLHFELNFRMLEKTDTIEAKIGNQFGVYFEIYSYSLRRIPIRYVWTFPSTMTNDKGEQFDKMDYTLYKTLNNEGWTNYVLENDWELIKGIWTLQMFYKDEMFYEKSFYLK